MGMGQPQIQAGGFFPRLIATFIDGIVVSLATLPVNIGVGILAANIADPGAMIGVQLLGMVLQLAITFYYYGYFYSKKGASLGKQAMGLHIIDSTTGQNLSFGKAIFRESIGKGVSMITMGIGFLMAAFRADSKALHDLIAGSHVLKK